MERSYNYSAKIMRSKQTRLHNARQKSLEDQFIELEKIAIEKYSMDLESLLLSLKDKVKLQRA